MQYNNFKYSKKYDSYITMINIYNFNKEQLDCYLRNDYKIIISDNINEEVIDLPERIKIDEILCHYVNDEKTIIGIELKLKNLDIALSWNDK